MDIMKIVNKAKDIIINPKGTLEKLKDEKVTKQDIIFYLAIVGFPTFLGTLIGYGVLSPWGTTFIGMAFGLAVAQYIFSIIGIIAFGYILNMLASNFKTKQSLGQSMKLVSYAATPWLLLGIVSIIPGLSLVALLGGLYGLYILYLGIPIMMGTPKEQQMPYFIVGLVVYFIIMVVVGWLTGYIWGAVVWSSVYNMYGYGAGNIPYWIR